VSTAKWGIYFFKSSKNQKKGALVIEKKEVSEGRDAPVFVILKRVKMEKFDPAARERTNEAGG
jgi:hypothetical protein